MEWHILISVLSGQSTALSIKKKKNQYDCIWGTILDNQLLNGTDPPPQCTLYK